MTIESSVPAAFVDVAGRHPSRIAIADCERALTFSQVESLARAIGHATVRTVGTRRGPVAALVRHDAHAPVAVLGVMMGGHPCVPLDAAHPLERNRVIAAHAGVTAIVAGRELAYYARTLCSNDVPVIEIDDVSTGHIQSDLPSSMPSDVACIVYTSGSTGTPKGVFQNHRGFLHDVAYSIQSASISPDDRVAVFYPLSVIAGLRTSFTGLLSGAFQRAIVPFSTDAAALARTVRDVGITVFRASPSLFRHVADALVPGDRLESVRLVLLGGDRVHWTDIDTFRRVCRPDASIGVHLGSTECWTVHSQWIVEDALRVDGERLPVGYAVPDRIVTVLDDHGRPVSDGLVGECVVRSRFVALGYWNDSELTARRFRPDDREPDVREYRTGDLVRRRPDGLLEYIGRTDHQVKLSGRTVDIGEIESVLSTCEGVAAAAVIVRPDTEGVGPVLVAYLERRAGARGLLPRHVKTMAAHRLPSHMIPAVIRFVDSIPRLPTFKPDRVRLRSLDAARPSSLAAECDPSVSAVIRIVENVLRITAASAEECFASLGGDSLQAVRIAAELEQEFGIPVPLAILHSAESIAELAAWLTQQRYSLNASRNQEPAPPRRRRAGLRPSLDLRTLRLDRLVREGHLSAARKEALRLQHTFADVPYVASLSRMLDRASNLPGEPIPFTNDRGADVQVIERVGADTVMLLFCGNRHVLGAPMQLLHQWFGRMPVSLVYLRDFTRRYYLGGISALGSDREATLRGLSQIVSRLRARRVLCWGSSSGTIAALHYGLELNASAIAGFGGPVDFSPAFNRHLRWAPMASELWQTFPPARTDIRRAYAAAQRPPRAALVYSDNFWDDRIHAHSVVGLRSFSLLSVEDCDDHNCTVPVIARGGIDAVLKWLQVEDASLPARIPVGGLDVAAQASVSAV